MNLAAKRQDGLLVGFALAAAVASAGWFGWQSVSARRVPPAAAARTKAAPAVPYQPSGIDAPKVETETWAPPPAQSRGASWVYDVFTPPEIFYDPRTKQFSVTAPTAETEAQPAPAPEAAAPFGLELREVKRAPFRLQLVGYMGGEGNYRGTFQNALTTETFLAGAGRRIPALGLEIAGFDVRRRAVVIAGNPPANRIVAMALVRDELTGETVELNSLERTLTNTPVAVVAAADDPGHPRELRAGEAFKSGAATYKITKIQLAPPAADVTKEAPDLPRPDSRTLTPTLPAGSPPTTDPSPPPSR
jgi:hypothetical protein